MSHQEHAVKRGCIRYVMMTGVAWPQELWSKGSDSYRTFQLLLPHVYLCILALFAPRVGDPFSQDAGILTITMVGSDMVPKGLCVGGWHYWQMAETLRGRA